MAMTSAIGLLSTGAVYKGTSTVLAPMTSCVVYRGLPGLLLACSLFSYAARNSRSTVAIHPFVSISVRS